jgi:hypothetical protein
VKIAGGIDDLNALKGFEMTEEVHLRFPIQKIAGKLCEKSNQCFIMNGL